MLGGLLLPLPAPSVPGAVVSRPSPQPSVQVLRERTEQLSLRCGACAVQLEHAQSLLAQFAEAHQELSPWLEETQGLGVQLSPNAISYEAFKEQQALLQVRGEVGKGRAGTRSAGSGVVGHERRGHRCGTRGARAPSIMNRAQARRHWCGTRHAWAPSVMSRACVQGR